MDGGNVYGLPHWQQFDILLSSACTNLISNLRTINCRIAGTRQQVEKHQKGSMLLMRLCYSDTWLLVSIGRVDATVFNSSRI